MGTILIFLMLFLCPPIAYLLFLGDHNTIVLHYMYTGPLTGISWIPMQICLEHLLENDNRSLYWKLTRLKLMLFSNPRCSAASFNYLVNWLITQKNNLILTPDNKYVMETVFILLDNVKIVDDPFFFIFSIF